MRLLLNLFGVLLCVTVITARFRFGFNSGLIKKKISNYLDKLISKVPCDKILRKMNSPLFKPIAHACDCVVEEMQEKHSAYIADLQNQISTLKEEAAGCNETIGALQTELDEISLKLADVCPDSSDLQVACSENTNFVFVESPDGCEAICYKAITNLVNYADAEAACSNINGSLITLETMTKNALVADTIRKNFGGNSFWIGLTFVGGQWTWKGGEQMNFSDWATSEPDANQDCASLNRVTEHRWFDWKCNVANKNGALCELTVA